MKFSCYLLSAALLFNATASLAEAQEKPVAGLIPKAQHPIKMDGKLDDWQGAFVTPIHVGNPDFANRGAEFLFLWDEQNLYLGLRALDQKPWDFGPLMQEGDAVEFYLDTRRGEQLGGKAFGPGTLHMFWTLFTKTEIAPRWAVRNMPAFKDLKLQGVELAGRKTPWGWTAEFKLPWANFPNFKPMAGEIIGIDCELSSSDGGPRTDRTFVYSSPADVATPSAFGRVRLVDKLEPADVKPLGRVLLPMSLTKSGNYGWLYGTACISRSIKPEVVKVQGKLLDRKGKVRKKTDGEITILAAPDLKLWSGKWETFDLPAGVYTLELTALDKVGKTITSRSEKFVVGNPVRPAVSNPR